MNNERYLFDNNTELRRKHADETELQPRRARRSHGYGSEIVTQADYAVKLLRQGVTEDIRARLADEFGRMAEWQEVCRCANDIHKVGLAYYE